jgi:glycosyltransferase involved in cell wall biosynthesis
MRRLSSLSIFFPAYNDAKIIPYLICKTYHIAPKVAQDFEIIVVNDGSKDDTAEVLQLLKKSYPKLRVINHEKNKGYGGALISGFAASKKEWVFYTDGDGQYRIEELPKLVEKVTNDIDVINGYKLKRGDGLLRQTTGTTYNRILHGTYKIPIRDIDCDYRLIRNSLMKNIHLSVKSGMICLELIIKLAEAGARFREVGVHHDRRWIGKSEFLRFSHLKETFVDNLSFLYSKKIAAFAKR